MMGSKGEQHERVEEVEYLKNDNDDLNDGRSTNNLTGSQQQQQEQANDNNIDKQQQQEEQEQKQQQLIQQQTSAKTSKPKGTASRPPPPPPPPPPPLPLRPKLPTRTATLQGSQVMQTAARSGSGGVRGGTASAVANHSGGVARVAASSSSRSRAKHMGPRSESTRQLVGQPGDHDFEQDLVDDDIDDYMDDSSGGLNSNSQFVNSSSATCGLTKNLAWAVLAGAVGASFQHGYNGGVVNAPEKLIGQFINQTYYARHGQVASDSQVDFIFALIVSIFCIGGCIGALMTAIVADKIGRKEGLFYNNVLVLLACPLMASARPLSSYELLIVGRLLIGINAGLNAGLAPLYLNEIAPTNLRGALGTIYQLVITASIFLSNVFGLPALLGTQELWPWLFVLPLLPAFFMLTSLPHLCESPKFLLLNQGHELEAQQAIAWFRETAEIHDEMDELRCEMELNKLSPAISLSEILHKQSLRKPLTISVVIMLSQQFSGINAVLFFSTSIFRSAGLSEHAAINATLGMSLVNVLMTIVSLILVDRAGRRTLHMTGLMGMACTCIVLALSIGSSVDQPTSHTASVISVVSIYIFIIMFASGPGSIPWFIVSELFPSNARPLATSIAVAVNWLANFTVSLCFLPLTNIFHGGVFFIFAFLLIIFYLFTYYKVPETKGATAEEISALFKR